MNCLAEIIKNKQVELEKAKQQVSLEVLEAAIKNRNSNYSLLQKTNSSSPDDFFVIAEFKRQSPSAGSINKTASIVKTLKSYQQAGAAAVSVLTESNRFLGTLADLQEARNCVEIPILRKDFIFDAYQVFEAKAFGADLILLIAEALSAEQISELTTCAHSLDLEVLLEFHEPSEISKLEKSKADFFGVNNRNLKTLEIDWQHALRLSTAFQGVEVPLVAESAIDSPEKLARLKLAGYQGFLIGEYLLKGESDPGERCSNLITAAQKIINEK